jgi:hypothetical protein
VAYIILPSRWLVGPRAPTRIDQRHPASDYVASLWHFPSSGYVDLVTGTDPWTKTGGVLTSRGIEFTGVNDQHIRWTSQPITACPVSVLIIDKWASGQGWSLMTSASTWTGIYGGNGFVNTSNGNTFDGALGQTIAQDRNGEAVVAATVVGANNGVAYNRGSRTSDTSFQNPSGTWRLSIGAAYRNIIDNEAIGWCALFGLFRPMPDELLRELSIRPYALLRPVTKRIIFDGAGAGGALSIDAAPGSIALSGVNAGAIADRSTNALPGSFSITGIDAGTIYVQANALNAETGAFALTGVNAAIVADRAINAQPASFAVTGIAAILVSDRSVNAQAGAFAISGSAGTLVADRMLSAATGSITVNGVAATLAIPGAQSIDALPGSFGITGTAASLIAGRSINAATGSFAETGIAATFAREKVLSADVGSYVVNGIDAILVAPLARELNAVPGSFAISGYAASLTLPSTVPSFLGHIHVLSEEYRSHVLRRK